ncbi:MAG: aldo/keto reductase [Planctomycetota bacterium]|jgi:predicted aldo/keto reductase-like oxidoreductase
MRRTILGKSGLEVSAVGFGGIPIMRVSEAEAVKVIQRALDLGISFIDTAAGYGDSQAKIGAAIAGRRDGLVLASKSGATTKDAILADVEESRRALRTDVIDIYQLHGVGEGAWETISGPDGALEGLIAAKEAGHVGHIGFTSHNLDISLKLASHEAFETVQFPYNLVAREPGDQLLPASRENNLGFIVMKPMCGGQFDDAGLAFKFLNAFPDLVAIPGVETCEEIEQIAAVVESGETLTGEEADRADKIVQRLGKVFCRRCGYCQPCPEEVNITSALIFESLAKRMPPNVAVSCAKGTVESIAKCTECGECVDKCPYDLPIPDLLKEVAPVAERFLAENETAE